jgi:molybdopterin molybdotransferase
MGGLVSVARVDAVLAGLTLPRAVEAVSLEAAVGRVLMQAIVADRDLPPFDRVMMDGYAIRHADLQSGQRFTVRGEALAGAARKTLSDAPLTAMAVMTGAPLPHGADTVVRIEATQRVGGDLVITKPDSIAHGDFVHRRGSDKKSGSLLVEVGQTLRSVEIGIAASAGYADLRVSVRPRLVAIGTGDEMVPVEVVPEAHQIRRSNAAAVMAALGPLPAQVSPPVHLNDCVETETHRLEQAVSCHDVVIISGAVSKGRLDWIPHALDRIGQCLFHGVAQRPGKPMGVWQTESGTVIFALPGNPVSTLVGAHRHLRPWLCKAMGLPCPVQRAVLSTDLSNPSPLTLFCPVRRKADGTAEPVAINNSGDYAALSCSDGFIELPDGQNHWTAGESVAFYPWI